MENVSKEQVLSVFAKTGTVSGAAKFLGKKPSAIRTKLISWAARGDVHVKVNLSDSISLEQQEVLDACAKLNTIRDIARETGYSSSSVRRKLDVLIVKGKINSDYIQKPAARSSFVVVAK